MAITRDPYVTAKAGRGASLGPLTSSGVSGPAGVWTLDGEAIVAADADGPATVLVPGEAVLLLAVDLPIANRARRLAALPFAIEDRIAEPVEAVHIAIGAELAPQRYLVGIVRHDRMAAWFARLAAEGLDHAALVPDALALPRPAEGEWAVDLGETRAVVRSGDGTGFAVPAPMLRTAWEAAGRPRIAASYGAPLPEDMAAGDDRLEGESLGRRLLAPALDLRQGGYARRRGAAGGWGRRLATIVAAGIAAHVLIAAADTMALKRIAAQRAGETRALVASVSPGTTLPADNLAVAVADLLPQPGAGGGDAFLAATSRLSAALAPLGAEVAVQGIGFGGGTLTLDIASSDPGLAARVDAALKAAGVQASVAASAGGVRVTMAVA